MDDWHRVPASIRDPDSWVETDGTIFRRHFRAASSWDDVVAAEAAGLFDSLGTDGLIPQHELVETGDGPGEGRHPCHGRERQLDGHRSASLITVCRRAPAGCARRRAD